MELLLPKAGGLKQIMPAASRIIHVCTITHTLQKVQQELNRNGTMRKTGHWCMHLGLRLARCLSSLFALGHFFSSCLTWLFEYFLKHLHCCVMETLQLSGNCLIPVLVTSCSPGSLVSFLLLCLCLLPGCIFPVTLRNPDSYYGVSWDAHLSGPVFSLYGTYNHMDI